MAGAVTVDGRTADKPGQLVGPGATLAVRQPEPYVSRGGYKLAHALDRFGLSVEGRIALDVGASTGGFTDVLLQRGAARVYAVDVGRGQLHARLAAEPRVVALDRTNIRYLDALPEPADFATIDVSFISLRLVVPAALRLLAPGSSMIVLVKPQFEAGREEVGHGGVVRSPSVHRRVLSEFASWTPRHGLAIRGLVRSPLVGASGNVEFLAWLAPGSDQVPPGADFIEGALAPIADSAQPSTSR